MTMKITFDLSDRDIQHFKRISKNAKALAKGAGEDEVIAATEKLLASVQESKTPDFIGERLQRLDSLIRMLRDTDWNLGAPERERVLAALAYFCDPEDVIPDVTPGFGFLDDAIMVELITTELKNEIDAYTDFCSYRDRESKRTGRANASREDWLANRRKDLFDRMRRRNKRDRSSSVRIRLF